MVVGPFASKTRNEMPNTYKFYKNYFSEPPLIYGGAHRDVIITPTEIYPVSKFLATLLTAIN